MSTVSSSTSSTTSSSSSTYVKSASSSNGTVSFAGISSGVDTATMVEELIAVERSGTDTRIANSTAEVNADISALALITESLTALQTATEALDSDATGNARTASIDDDAGFSASVDSGAAIGSYEIEVSQLAQNHKLTSDAYASTDTVGSGTLTISSGDSSISVPVNATNTLSDIADAINTVANGSVVTASIISTDEGDRLVLTSVNSGADYALTVSSSDTSLAALTYPASSDSSASMSETTAAQDAIILIDGYTKTSSSNSISDALDGVTLELESTTVGTSYTLEIEADTEAITEALTTFVDAYNTVIETLAEVSAYDTDSEDEEDSTGALAGDSLVRNLKSQLRMTISSNSYELDLLGITTDKTGAMTLDTSTLSSALSQNPSAVGSLFNADDSTGLGGTLSGIYDSMLDTYDGLIPQRDKALDEKLLDLEQQTVDLDYRMERLQATYEAEFTAMEKTMSEMETTSTYLDQYLNTDDDDDD